MESFLSKGLINMITNLKRLAQADIYFCAFTITSRASASYSYLIIASLFFFIIGCGGGSESTTPAPITTTPPPVVITTPVYGLLNLSDPEVTLVLTEDRSYLFSVANNLLPPEELMCTSDESFEEFSATLTSQTLNFNCSGTSTINQSIVAELVDDTLELKYFDGSQHDHTIELAAIIKLESPNFSNIEGGNYTTRLRNDINISRYIYVSPRPPNSIDFVIFSRDWPLGGDCLTSFTYRVPESPTFEVNQTYESILANYSSSPISNSSTYCDSRTLTMPSRGEPIAARFYTLENGSYFLSIEQDNFITMGMISFYD
jgi:hypothetical protein